MTKYNVWHENGIQVKEGETLKDFRGGKAVFLGCTHPRKINVRYSGSNGMQVRYPAIFDVIITEDITTSL